MCAESAASAIWSLIVSLWRRPTQGCGGVRALGAQLAERPGRRIRAAAGHAVRAPPLPAAGRRSGSSRGAGLS
eukprot:1044879-Alexandrium_andersonii.AAC.1